MIPGIGKDEVVKKVGKQEKRQERLNTPKTLSGFSGSSLS